MIVVGEETVMIALGGAEPDRNHPSNRVLYSGDRGGKWNAADVPLPRGPASGIFSLCFIDSKNGVAVGGDYLKPDSRDGNFAVTRDGGKTWAAPDQAKSPSGYRSCVAVWRDGDNPVLIAVGPNGTDRSNDLGNRWDRISVKGFHSVEFAPGGKQGWATGGNGRIARWVVR